MTGRFEDQSEAENAALGDIALDQEKQQRVPTDDPVEGPYSVDVSSVGCEHCGDGTMYAVVFDGEEQLGMQWSDRSAVEEWAEAMNLGFIRGRSSVHVAQCCNEYCCWVGLSTETVHPKHMPGFELCPKCHEVTESACPPPPAEGVCGQCNGAGVPLNGVEGGECPVCGGSGKVTPVDPYKRKSEPCPRCSAGEGGDNASA